jgi:hypothetical protein
MYRYVTVNNIKILSLAQKCLGEFISLATLNILMSSCRLFDNFCPILAKCTVFLQIFLEVTTIKSHGSPSSGSHAATCGQTDGLDIANRQFLQSCESKQKAMFQSQFLFFCFLSIILEHKCLDCGQQVSPQYPDQTA